MSFECPSCKKILPQGAAYCDCGRSFIGVQVEQASTVAPALTANPTTTNWPRLILLLVLLAVTLSIVRIYVGSPLGFQVVFKSSPSFTDTYVNLDDVIGMPNIVFAAQHPAVKRQLQEMGVIETDEQMERRIRQKFESDMATARQKAEEDHKQLMQKLGIP